MKCNKCSQESIISLPYGPHHFCKNHFLEFFEKKVRKTIRVNKLINAGDKVLVGVSGGKDSACVLYLVNKIFGKTINLNALLIDEGIQGYRDKAVKKGIELCKELKVNYKVISLKKEIGYSMDEIIKKIKSDPGLGSSCSFCGVFRREILNKKALEMNADKVVTGHNLDDETQSIAMNLFDGDVSRLARLGPSTGIKKLKGFVERIKPLYESPERETNAFIKFLNLPHYQEECCPYSWMAKRNSYRKIINELEEGFPGTKYSLLSSFKQLKPLLQKKFNSKEKAKKCRCGSITMQELCGACKLKEKLMNSKPTGKKPKEKKKLTCSATKKWNY
ncbi:MAG: TIGR00269 family protein [Candidatus Diapherotrites archaeon]